MSARRVVIVIEKLNELDHVLNIAERHEGRLPMLGMRVKLYSKGSGRWEKSGGEAAKFGLTTTEMLEVIRRLEEADRIDMLQAAPLPHRLAAHRHQAHQECDEGSRARLREGLPDEGADRAARRRRRHGGRLRRLENRV